MKKLIFTILISLLVTSVIAQGNSVNFEIGKKSLKKQNSAEIMVTGVSQTTSIAVGNPINNTVPAGTIKGTFNGTEINFYCIDAANPLANEKYVEYGKVTKKEIAYILNNYYPFKALGYPGSLSTAKKEAAAIQVAIWHFSDNVDINSVTNSEIRNRANVIAQAASNSSDDVVQTLLIRIPSQSFLIGQPVEFFVEAYDANNAPIPNVNITLSVDNGATLSATSTMTNANGISNALYLTQGSLNTAKIKAEATLIVPQGTEFRHHSNPDGKQKIVLATPFEAKVNIEANVQWFGQPDLSIEKTGSTETVKNGEDVQYVIKVKNTGNAAANNVIVSDQLSSYLQFISTDGDYNPTTGLWSVGTLAVGQEKVLTINCKAIVPNTNPNILDLGVASPFNLFVFNNLTQPSADTQGKVAIGNDASFANYSVGDRDLGGDALIVGRRLDYLSGWVYGNIVYGEFFSSPQVPNDTTQYLCDGTIRKESVIDFVKAKVDLKNVAVHLAALAPNGTVEHNGYGRVTLTGTNPILNVFLVEKGYFRTHDENGIIRTNDVQIHIPEGSYAVINVADDAPSFSGGMVVKYSENNAVHGGGDPFADNPALLTTASKILFNFYQANVIKIGQIGFIGTILAPDADLDYTSGVIQGQVIVNNVFTGVGAQFNWVKYTGEYQAENEIVITNVAQILSFNSVAGQVVTLVNSNLENDQVVLTQKEEKELFNSPINMLNNEKSKHFDFFNISMDANSTTSIENRDNSLPKAFELKQNYPNPFNPSTTIEFTVPVKGFYLVRVFNILGQEVAELVNGELSAGSYKKVFNANNLTSGIYFYNIKGDKVNITKKMMLVK